MTTTPAEYRALLDAATGRPWDQPRREVTNDYQFGICTDWYLRQLGVKVRSEANAALIVALVNDAETLVGAVEEVERLRPYAGPGPYEPDDQGFAAPTWADLRALADHNFGLYANVCAERDLLRAEVETLRAGAGR